jgi:L-fuconolactonase
MYDPVDYSWITDEMTSIRGNFWPSELKTEIRTTDINSVISVQARQSLEETDALLFLAERADFVGGVVGWVPFVEPNVGDTIAKLALNRSLRGFRHVLQDEPDPNYMLRDDFNSGIDALHDFDLAYDILIFERQLPQTIQFIDRHPDQVFVLDHCGKPRVKTHEVSPWAERMRELAKRPNVYCKLSGLVTEAEHQNWTEDQLQPYFNVVLEAFTPQRVMFGSDWPVCLLATSYAKWVRIVERFCSKLSEAEQERIWWRTANDAYRLGLRILGCC